VRSARAKRHSARRCSHASERGVTHGCTAFARAGDFVCRHHVLSPAHVDAPPRCRGSVTTRVARLSRLRAAFFDAAMPRSRPLSRSTPKPAMPVRQAIMPFAAFVAIFFYAPAPFICCRRRTVDAVLLRSSFRYAAMFCLPNHVVVAATPPSMPRTLLASFVVRREETRHRRRCLFDRFRHCFFFFTPAMLFSFTAEAISPSAYCRRFCTISPTPTTRYRLLACLILRRRPNAPFSATPAQAPRSPPEDMSFFILCGASRLSHVYAQPPFDASTRAAARVTRFKRWQMRTTRCAPHGSQPRQYAVDRWRRAVDKEPDCRAAADIRRRRRVAAATRRAFAPRRGRVSPFITTRFIAAAEAARAAITGGVYAPLRDGLLKDAAPLRSRAVPPRCRRCRRASFLQILPAENNDEAVRRRASARATPARSPRARTRAPRRAAVYHAAMCLPPCRRHAATRRRRRRQPFRYFTTHVRDGHAARRFVYHRFFMLFIFAITPRATRLLFCLYDMPRSCRFSMPTYDAHYAAHGVDA